MHFRFRGSQFYYPHKIFIRTFICLWCTVNVYADMKRTALNGLTYPCTHAHIHTHTHTHTQQNGEPVTLTQSCNWRTDQYCNAYCWIFSVSSSNMCTGYAQVTGRKISAPGPSVMRQIRTCKMMNNGDCAAMWYRGWARGLHSHYQTWLCRVHTELWKGKSFGNWTVFSRCGKMCLAFVGLGKSRELLKIVPLSSNVKARKRNYIKNIWVRRRR